MKVKYNKEDYVDLCLEKEREIVVKTAAEWKGLILFDLCLFVINFFVLYLIKLPSVFRTVYLLFCILLMSFQIYLIQCYQSSKKAKILLIYSIL